MRNFLNTTFTFDKQTEENFINRKVRCRPTYSFIHSLSCPLFLWGESRGQQPLENPKYLTINSTFKKCCSLHTKTRPSKVGDVVTPPGP